MPSQNVTHKVAMENVKMNPNHPHVRDVSPEEVLKKSSEVVLVDVRTNEEIHGELGHIKNIKHIVLDEIGGRINELPKEKTVVFICRSGMRSATAAAFAHDEGLDVYNMAGGMLLWNQLKLPVERKS